MNSSKINIASMIVEFNKSVFKPSKNMRKQIFYGCQTSYTKIYEKRKNIPEI